MPVCRMFMLALLDECTFMCGGCAATLTFDFMITLIGATIGFLFVATDRSMLYGGCDQPRFLQQDIDSNIR